MKPDKKVLGGQVYNWLLASIEEHAFELLNHLGETQALIRNGKRHYADRAGLPDIEGWLLEEIQDQQAVLAERFREISNTWLG